MHKKQYPYNSSISNETILIHLNQFKHELIEDEHLKLIELNIQLIHSDKVILVNLCPYLKINIKLKKYSGDLLKNKVNTKYIKFYIIMCFILVLLSICVNIYILFGRYFI